MAVLIKICGITRLEDALVAAEAGAEALGFMFYASSKRHVAPTAAAEIIRRLPGDVAKVGVFVNPTEAEAREAVRASGVDTLQFHGEETPAFCGRFAPWRVWKAFRMRDRDSLRLLPAYAGVDGWLLDSYVAEAPGGTGERFDWDLAVEVRSLGRPVILAGGLTPENVGEAVRRVQPWGVDVSSGVEQAPGRKDAAKVRAFITAVRRIG